ncbi:MAG: hypothetical protein Q8Q12_08840, partial [bacterium]|nr:hypothetical protein [bacterium]
MARNKLLLVGIVFLPILLFASPAFSVITSDGTLPGVPVGDDWELTFIKLAGTSDTTMPDPTLDYNDATGEYTVTSAGHDIWDSQDGCAFTYMTIPTGDWSVRVQVDSDFTGPATNTWSKAGVMVRDSLTPESKQVFYATTRNDGGDACMQWRDTDNAASGYTALDAAAGSLGERWWLRLDRVGNDFYGFYSTDGTSWTASANPVFHTNAGFSDPVYVGFVLTSHEATVETTMVFSNFEVPGYEPGTKAKADSPVWGYGNEAITLDGSKSTKTTTYLWTQIKETGDPTVAITNANQAVATITPPGADIGYDLLFRLTVTGETGTDSKDVRVNVRAINAPKVAPGPFRIMPLDLGAAGLGFRADWPELFDAEQYDIGIEFGGSIIWLETIGVSTYDVKGLTAGTLRTIAIRGKNKYGSSDDPTAISKVSRVAMRNLARPASMGGTTEPSDHVYVISHYAITGMNNIVYDDNNDSWNGLYKTEDYWGYLWASPLFFDHIAYYTGDMFGDGGWFLDLKLQYTTDGTTWLDAPIVKIEPAYDFTDQFTGKDDFARYDIEIPTLRGTGIRIAGTPGGSNTFTSIAEMEVFGLQTQGPLIVQGIDAEFPEGGTALLDGSISFSTAGPITSYQWTGPLAITNPTSAIASFQAPHVAADTTYVFSLQAGDGTNTGTDADVQILVKNLVTTAVAGLDQSVEEATQATLDGSGSLTTTGNITYLWTQTAGTNVNVTGKTTATVNFTAPIIWDYEEDLTFNLAVNDGAGGTSSDEVVVTVRNALAWPAYPVTYPATTSYLQNMLHLGTNSTDRLMNPHNWGNITSGLDPLEPFGGVRNIRPYPGLAYDFTGTAPTPNRNPLVWTPVFSNSG